jgi:hypothetical protein
VARLQPELLHLLQLLLHLFFDGSFFLKQLGVSRALLLGVLRMECRLWQRLLTVSGRAPAFAASDRLHRALQEAPFGAVDGHNVIFLNGRRALQPLLHVNPKIASASELPTAQSTLRVGCIAQVVTEI